LNDDSTPVRKRCWTTARADRAGVRLQAGGHRLDPYRLYCRKACKHHFLSGSGPELKANRASRLGVI
jgi:hypothetical protein